MVNGFPLSNMTTYFNTPVPIFGAGQCISGYMVVHCETS